MIGRRAFIAGVTAILGAPLGVQAQHAAKMRRIGVLAQLSPAAAATSAQVMREALRRLGYAEGQNIALELKLSDAQDLLAEHAAHLARLNVDVIVAVAVPAALAAKRTTTTIPIVMIGGGDPVQNGLIASLARPGGNITGTAALTPDLTAKQLEILRETFPRISRVAALWNGLNPAFPLMWPDLESTARTLHIRLDSVAVRGSQDFETAFAALLSTRPDALLLLPDALMFTNLERVANFAISNRIPAIFMLGEFAAFGGLLSYGPNLADLVRTSMRYVDRVLKGTKPADLPVEQPTKFELIINMKTARRLGLTIPPALLQRADQVIE